MYVERADAMLRRKTYSERATSHKCDASRRRGSEVPEFRPCSDDPNERSGGGGSELVGTPRQRARRPLRMHTWVCLRIGSASATFRIELAYAVRWTVVDSCNTMNTGLWHCTSY